MLIKPINNGWFQNPCIHMHFFQDWFVIQGVKSFLGFYVYHTSVLSPVHVFHAFQPCKIDSCWKKFSEAGVLLIQFLLLYFFYFWHSEKSEIFNILYQFLSLLLNEVCSLSVFLLFSSKLHSTYIPCSSIDINTLLDLLFLLQQLRMQSPIHLLQDIWNICIAFEQIVVVKLSKMWHFWG